ncbi:hypothetical protein QR680_014671 [Steinernema hermaphroditum]|uniref:Twinfilin n=1 Tax=Steinernema hermaphroditum TaxID=289476 RepID=A0AA39ICB6_9BILA|nr:hypothetical protein QR680_014671 [Steinernema hermaphroditum]
MACQTADRELHALFEDCKEGKVRLAKIVVRNEALSLNFKDAGSDDWKADWRKNLPSCIDAYEPCYILFKLKSPTDWLLISFADDRAPVREKMLLAATRSTFKSEFGQHYISYEYQATNIDDVKLDKFELWLESRLDPRPMTEHERDLHLALKEKCAMGNLMPATQTLRGVEFPIDQDATALLKQFGRGEIDFVQLSVDTLNEAIKLESHADRLEPEKLSSMIDRKKPRYSFYRLRSGNGSPNGHTLFIYSVPPSGGCTIKELMLFSSCKSVFLNTAQNALGISLDKKIEVDSRDKLDEKALLEYLNVNNDQSPTSGGPKFSRPQGPQSRGQRRLIKQQ